MNLRNLRHLWMTVFCVICLSIGVIGQSPDRAKPPAVGPAPALKTPAIQKSRLANGLAVWIVEHHEVPVVQVNLIVRSGSAADAIGKYGVGNLTAAMLDEGAGGRSALELADAIEFLGATIATTSTFDASSVRLSVPVTRLADALPLAAAIALRPPVPREELERRRKERRHLRRRSRDRRHRRRRSRDRQGSHRRASGACRLRAAGAGRTARGSPAGPRPGDHDTNHRGPAPSRRDRARSSRERRRRET